MRNIATVSVQLLTDHINVSRVTLSSGRAEQRVRPRARGVLRESADGVAREVAGEGAAALLCGRAHPLRLDVVLAAGPRAALGLAICVGVARPRAAGRAALPLRGGVRGHLARLEIELVRG